jgi:hypothetical protein
MISNNGSLHVEEDWSLEYSGYLRVFLFFEDRRYVFSKKEVEPCLG